MQMSTLGWLVLVHEFNSRLVAVAERHTKLKCHVWTAPGWQVKTSRRVACGSSHGVRPVGEVANSNHLRFRRLSKSPRCLPNLISAESLSGILILVV